MKIIIACAFTFALLGCSTSEVAPNSEIAAAKPPQSFEIYFSRANLLGPTEFEHYKIFNGKLFSECGKILRERNVTESQQLITLESESWNELLQSAAKVLDSDAAQRRSLESPGKNSNLFDPGKALFTFLISASDGPTAELPIETSLDSITSPSSLLERNLTALSTMVRGAAKDTCGNQTFFGMAKG